MNRGLEIFRRLLVSCLWVVGTPVVVYFTAGSIYNYIDVTSEEPVKMSQKPSLQDERSSTYIDWETTFEKRFITKLKRAERLLWISIGTLFVFPFAGYGLHRLINWILIYKAED